MILVGGAAVGFAGYRGSMGRINPFESPAHRITGFFLALSSLVVLALRLRQPRPSVRRIIRQQGTVACFAALSMTLLTKTHQLVIWFPSPFFSEQLSNLSVGEWVWFLASGREEPAYVVGIAWIIFVLGRLVLREEGWIDRSGRVVGWSWIAWGFWGLILGVFF